MVKSYEVIGYACDADIYCPECVPYENVDTDEDSEGNQIHPIFIGDEDSDKESCCVCHEYLWDVAGIVGWKEETEDEDDEEDFKDGVCIHCNQPAEHRTVMDGVLYDCYWCTTDGCINNRHESSEEDINLMGTLMDGIIFYIKDSEELTPDQKSKYLMEDTFCFTYLKLLVETGALSKVRYVLKQVSEEIDLGVDGKCLIKYITDLIG